jgi:hypothetical protein
MGRGPIPHAGLLAASLRVRYLLRFKYIQDAPKRPTHPPTRADSVAGLLVVRALPSLRPT